MDYWIIWGYTQDLGLWATRDSREDAEQLLISWRCQNPKMRFATYHVKHEEGAGHVA